MQASLGNRLLTRSRPPVESSKLSVFFWNPFTSTPHWRIDSGKNKHDHSTTTREDQSQHDVANGYGRQANLCLQENTLPVRTKSTVSFILQPSAPYGNPQRSSQDKLECRNPRKGTVRRNLISEWGKCGEQDVNTPPSLTSLRTLGSAGRRAESTSQQSVKTGKTYNSLQLTATFRHGEPQT